MSKNINSEVYETGERLIDEMERKAKESNKLPEHIRNIQALREGGIITAEEKVNLIRKVYGFPPLETSELNSMIAQITDIPKKKEIVYISGKITGEDNYKEKFGKAEEELIQLGYKVLNPAKLDQIHADLDYEDYMTLCYAMIDICDSVYLLEDWTTSPGAKKEYYYAQVHDKELYYETDFKYNAENEQEVSGYDG